MGSREGRKTDSKAVSIDLIQYSYAGVVYLYLLYYVMYSLCVPRAKKKFFTIVGHMSTLSYPCNRLLLEKNSIDLNSKDNNGRTPLSRAAERGNQQVVKL